MSNTAPRVTVIIPAYNAESFVAEAVDSVLGQTYRNVEVVCVNDGSTDATGEILRSFGEAIRTITIRNSGVSAARNRALAAATGELVAFLDADNYLHPSCLELEVRRMQETGADLVFCNRIIVRSDGSLQHLNSRPDPAGMDPFLYCLHHNDPFTLRACIDTNVALHRVEPLTRIGGWSTNVRRFEDKDLTFRLAAAGSRFAYLDEELCYYRDHAGPRLTDIRNSPGYLVQYFVRLASQLAESDSYSLTLERRRALADRIIDCSKAAYRAGFTADARAGFACARRLTDRLSHRNESRLYRLLTGIVGYPGAELMRKVSGRGREADEDGSPT